MAICKSGLWVDTKSGQVVDEVPVEGVVLVAAGMEITPDRQALVDRARAAAPPRASEPEQDADESKAAAAPEVAAIDGAPESAAMSGKTGVPKRR